MFFSSHFWDFFLCTSATAPPACWTEAATDEAVEPLFFRIPLMGPCEAVGAAILGERRAAAAASHAPRLKLQRGLAAPRRRPHLKILNPARVTESTAGDITVISAAVSALGQCLGGGQADLCLFFFFSP